MAYLASRNQNRTDIWPGFVDALSALLMVIIFLLMVFVVAQFFLSDALSGRNAALQRLQNQVSSLADLLNLERQANAELRENAARLSDELNASISININDFLILFVLTLTKFDKKNKIKLTILTKLY